MYRTLARVMSALFATQGHAWGTRELIASLATDMACNDCGSDSIGRTIEPLLLHAARSEGYRLLPRQERPVVINTKGASASGKSTLRPLQKKVAGDIGAQWSDFALISPDIWRKQLLDYEALGADYKYAGAFTAEELQIIDQKLDRYMARKHRRGDMTHLLIDRFRFDSFAPDSAEAGSNLLTRFGQTVYLFFMITPPELLVERAWTRGLEFGRYKAVDDTLAHAVEAYTGIPDVFFTWVRRSDKQIQFEFLDNTVRLGERPRTVAFGNNDAFNVLNVKGMLNIERYGRVNVDAAGPESLYADRGLLDPEHNTRFLRRCMEGFREVNFAEQATGRFYLRIESGTPVWMDAAAMRSAVLERHQGGRADCVIRRCAGRRRTAVSARRSRRPHCADARAMGERLIQEIAKAVDVRREVEGVLPGQLFRQLGVAPLQRFDDLEMIDDRTGGTVVLYDRRTANGAHMNEKIARRIDDGLRTAQGDYRRMKCDVGIGILIQMLGRRRVLELVEQVPQSCDLSIAGVQGREPRRHGLERRPHLDHFDHFALGLADDVDTAPRYRADESFLLEQRQRFSNRGPADAERRRELPLIQPQFLVWIVDIGVRDRVLEKRVGLIAQTRCVQRRERERSRGGRPLYQSCDGVHRMPRRAVKITDPFVCIIASLRATHRGPHQWPRHRE